MALGHGVGNALGSQRHSGLVASRVTIEERQSVATLRGHPAAGRRIRRVFPAAPNQMLDFEWDGPSGLGRPRAEAFNPAKFDNYDFRRQSTVRLMWHNRSLDRQLHHRYTASLRSGQHQ